MSPAGSELTLERAVKRGAALRRQVAGWTLAGGGACLMAIVTLAAWTPLEWLATPRSPLPMVLALLGMSSVVVAGLVAGRAIRRPSGVPDEIERSTGLGAGDLSSALELRREPHGSAELAGLHRARVARALGAVSERAWLPQEAARLGRLRRRITTALAILVALTAAGTVGRPSPWRAVAGSLATPWTVTFPPPPAPMSVMPRGAKVIRGSFLRVRVTGVGRSSINLAWSPPGEPIRRVTGNVVDGWTELEVGPVEATTLYWAEDEWGQATDTFRAVPLDPLTLVNLELSLSFPTWLGKPDERLSTVPGSVVVPVGTEIRLRGEANYDLRRAAVLVRSEAGVDTIGLGDAPRRVEGRFIARRSGRLEWSLEPRARVPAVAPPPPLELNVTPDAGPRIEILHPGRDLVTTPGGRVPLVIEARDDHGLESVALFAWRESTAGRREPPIVTRLDEARSTAHIVARVALDPGAAGVLPGDAIAYYATTRDRNPAHGPAVSDTFRVRIASLEEQAALTAPRVEAMANRARDLDERAGRLAEDARSAGRRTSLDAAVADESAGQAGRTDYGSTEEAREVLRQARSLQEEVDRTVEEIRLERTRIESSATPEASLLADLQRLEELYREILDSDLGERIAELERALRSMDRTDVREALASMARETGDVEQTLHRAVALLDRAAIEQALKGARRRADDLVDRQTALTTRETADTAWAREETRVEKEVRSLADEVEGLEDRLERSGDGEAGRLVARAAADLERAADLVADALAERVSDTGEEPGSPGASGVKASEGTASLERAERRLADASEHLRRNWKAEALQAVDRATEEALELAREQADVLSSLERGEASAELAGRQAALRHGLDNLAQSLADAGQRTALLDRRAGAAAARAGEIMERVSENLSPGSGRRSEAMTGASEVLRSLGDLATSLVSSRRGIAEAASGTGLEEALARLSRMGQRQASLNGETGDLLLSLRRGLGGAEGLPRLAERQMGVARELARLAEHPASGELAGRPDELAREAEEIARRLATGDLGDGVLARQERLFRRLLDAGRLLQREDEDPDRRESTTARPVTSVVRVDSPTDAGAPRFPYPSDEELRGLSAAQRRMVFEYFDLLNGRGTTGNGVP